MCQLVLQQRISELCQQESPKQEVKWVEGTLNCGMTAVIALATHTHLTLGTAKPKKDMPQDRQQPGNKCTDGHNRVPLGPRKKEAMYLPSKVLTSGISQNRCGNRGLRLNSNSSNNNKNIDCQHLVPTTYQHVSNNFTHFIFTKLEKGGTIIITPF